VFMIFEITQDYQILVPLMVANMLSFVISKRYQSVPVYHALLHQDHIHLPVAAPRPSSRTWRAADLMVRDVPWVASDATVAEAWAAAQRSGRPAVLIGRPGVLAGIISTSQLREAIGAAREREPVRLLVRSDIPHAHPDHPFEIVLERFAESGGALPIVSREAANRVEGVVTLDGMFRVIASGPTPEERISAR
jgi:chloride channel protein, CIC family